MSRVNYWVLTGRLVRSKKAGFSFTAIYMTGDTAGLLKTDGPIWKRARLEDNDTMLHQDNNDNQPRALMCNVCHTTDIQTVTLTCTALMHAGTLHVYGGDTTAYIKHDPTQMELSFDNTSNNYKMTLQTNELHVQKVAEAGYGTVHCGPLACQGLTVNNTDLEQIILDKINNTTGNADTLTLVELRLGTMIQGGDWSNQQGVVWTHNVDTYTDGTGTLFTINPATMNSETFAGVYLSCDEFVTVADSYAFQIVHPNCHGTMFPSGGYHGQLRIGSILTTAEVACEGLNTGSGAIVCTAQESNISGLKIRKGVEEATGEVAHVILGHSERNYGWMFDNYPQILETATVADDARRIATWSAPGEPRVSHLHLATTIHIVSSTPEFQFQSETGDELARVTSMGIEIYNPSGAGSNTAKLAWDHFYLSSNEHQNRTHITPAGISCTGGVSCGGATDFSAGGNLGGLGVSEYNGDWVRMANRVNGCGWLFDRYGGERMVTENCSRIDLATTTHTISSTPEFQFQSETGTRHARVTVAGIEFYDNTGVNAVSSTSKIAWNHFYLSSNDHQNITHITPAGISCTGGVTCGGMNAGAGDVYGVRNLTLTGSGALNTSGGSLVCGAITASGGTDFAAGGWMGGLGVSGYNDNWVRMQNRVNGCGWLFDRYDGERITTENCSRIDLVSTSTLNIQTTGGAIYLNGQVANGTQLGNTTMYGAARITFDGSWQGQTSSMSMGQQAWGIGFYNSRDGSTAAYIDGNVTTASKMNFTGQHRTFVQDVLIGSVAGHVGQIVCAHSDAYVRMSNGLATGADAITINESLPVVSLSRRANDKACFGVISAAEDPNERSDSYGALVSIIDKEVGDTRVYINSVGEGAMWVINARGGLESGDYITTSDVPGYGQRQDDDILHNYTVAKVTMNCDFQPKLVPRQRVLRALQRKTVWVVTSYKEVTQQVFDGLDPNDRREVEGPGKDQVRYEEIQRFVHEFPVDGGVAEEREIVSNVLDANGQLQWEDTDEMVPAYQVRYLDANGVEVVDATVAVHTAAFVGCTYHCG